MSELFETLPEIGDPDKPKLCFFSMKRTLPFNGVPKASPQEIEQVVRLIRSKGVAFVSSRRTRIDIPDNAAPAAGNRVQYKPNAFTPRPGRRKARSRNLSAN
ncbi:MAG: DUF853 family protein [Sphingomonadales bacterium]|nr:DUF853 family protein [Sphingomonadales bacterium]